MKWKPADGVDLDAIEDRLDREHKLIFAYIPGRGTCYAIVRKHKKRKSVRFVKR